MIVLLLALALGHVGPGKPPEGAVCNAAEAAAAEKHIAAHPDDLTARRRLLTYYLHRHRDPALRKARVEQIAWMVEHYPGARLFDQRAWIVDTRDEGFARVRELWLRQVKRFPHDLQVLANAGLALSLSDREAAAEWLKKVPNTAWERGMLYADAITGVTARTPYYGIGAVDPAAARSPFARRVVEEMRRSTDAVLVFHTGWHLHLAAESLCAREHNRLAEELLERAVKLARFDYQADGYRDSLRMFHRRSAGPCALNGKVPAPEPDGLVVNGICPAEP